MATSTRPAKGQIYLTGERVPWTVRIDNTTHRELDDDEGEELRGLYRGRRVTDVTDGLDYIGFHDVNQLDWDVRPLHRDPEAFSHRVVGFAHTVRFHPTNRRRPERIDREAFDEWKVNWYREYASRPFEEEICEGDVIVIEAHGTEVGFVKQGLPVYSKHVNKTIRPGQLELDDTGIPVNVGSYMIRPNDFVADGDGVVVVPIEVAREVAADARHVQSADQETREHRDEKAGLPKDVTRERPDERGGE